MLTMNVSNCDFNNDQLKLILHKVLIFDDYF